MGKTDRQEQWRRWHHDLCSRFPQIQKLTTETWPRELASSVDQIFADQERPEPDRLARAEQHVLDWFASRVPEPPNPELRTCLADAVRLQVQDAFEDWKIEASVG